MGRPPKVTHVRTAFEGELNAARNLVSSINALPGAIHPNASGIHPKHARQVVALAFMGIVGAWEEFIERTLTRYVAGAQTDGGHAPTPKHGKATSLGHAYEVLSGKHDYDSKRDYLKFSNANWVSSQASFLFTTHPYTGLPSAHHLLLNASKIRNRVAHKSEKCKAEFKEAALWFLAPANGKLTQSYSPGNLLMDAAARHFTPAIINANVTHFEGYMRLYEGLARQIVPP